MGIAVRPYLTFDGNCEEAFNFYKSVFGKELTYIGRFGDMPPLEGQPVIAPEYANRIMHVTLPIDNDFVLFGSDNMEGSCGGTDLVIGNNMSLSLQIETKGEADRIFEVLSKGGIVSVPMGNTFWNAYFGMFTDRFGINWMINVELS